MVYDKLPLLTGIFCGKGRSESEGGRRERERKGGREREKERGGVGRGVLSVMIRLSYSQRYHEENPCY